MEDDANMRALLEAETPVVTIFGKSWDLHVTEVLRTTLEENLAHDPRHRRLSGEAQAGR